MSCADDRSEVVRILHPVEHYQKFCPFHYFVQLYVTVDCSEGDYVLVRNAFSRAVERFARFEAHGNTRHPAEIDYLLNARSRRTFCNDDFVQRPAGAQRLADWMNTEN